MSSNSNTSATSSTQPSCPVNHEARAVWLRSSNLNQNDNIDAEKLNHKSNGQPSSLAPSSPTKTCDSSKIDHRQPTSTIRNPSTPSSTRDSPSQSSSTPATTPPSSSFSSILPYLPFNRQHRRQEAAAAAAVAKKEQDLNTERQVSSIPRVSLDTPGSSEDANVTKEKGPQAILAGANTASSGNDTNTTPGNWIYPSERMFFDAMRRKSYDPKAEDMRAIVPIHNAVNERAWKEIREWERGKGAEKCGGPRLLSFSGTATALTPRARFNTWLGYQPPFDRHDWVVDRCGTPVEYVIDFYQGRDEGQPGKSLNFYLDVRPKLNSWEGWRLRAEKLIGV